MPNVTLVVSHEAIERMMGEGRWHEAAAACQLELARLPTCAKLHLRFGDCLVHLGATAEAARAYERAGILDPLLEEAGVRHAQCLERMGDVEEGYRVARHWLNVAPNNRFLAGIAERLGLRATEGRRDGWERTRRLDRQVRFASDD